MGFNRAAHCYMVNGKVQPMFGYQSMDAYSDIVSYTWSGDWQKCGGICGSQAPTPAPLPTAAPTSDPYVIIDLPLSYRGHLFAVARGGRVYGLD